MMKSWLLQTAGLTALAAALSSCGEKQPPSDDFPEIPAHILSDLAKMNQSARLVWADLVYPTGQTALLEPPRIGVFQPTAAGNVESAMFGSVRTAERGGRLMPSFHEGIDIAPLLRDRRGRPEDPVGSVAAGSVAHVSPVAGNSSYGKYAVVVHPDPVGPVFTLYAHLASISSRKGNAVAPGDPLGIMGNTATYSIPMERAHLHFEIGVILNARFGAWLRSQKLDAMHDQYHGWNLLGLDPLLFLDLQRKQPDIAFRDVLAATPEAFSLIVRSKRLPDYFQRYPSLWEGAPFTKGIFWAAFSENGIPLRARNATDDEIQTLGMKRRATVSDVHPEVLKRNGRRLVVPRNDAWTLGAEGEKHLDMMLF